MLKFQFFFNFVKSGQTMVKLLIQEVLVLLNNYSRILVLLNIVLKVRPLVPV